MSDQDLPSSADSSCVNEIQSGDRIDDFLLIRELRTRNDSRLFLAEQISMHRWVELEVHANDGQRMSELVQLDHPNIIRSFDRRVSADARFQLTNRQYSSGGSLSDLIEAISDSQHEWNGLRLLQWLDDQAASQGEEVTNTDSLQRDRLSQLTWIESVSVLGGQIASAVDFALQHGCDHPELSTADVWLGQNGVPRVDGFRRAESGATSQTRLVAELIWDMMSGQPDETSASQSPETTGLAIVISEALRPSSELTIGQLASQLQICEDEASANLLLRRRGGWSGIALRAPLAVALLTLLIPNVLAGIFNYLYNFELIVVPLNANETFTWVMTMINAIAYPGACGLAIWGLWRICREIGLRESATSAGLTKPVSPMLLRACLETPMRFAMLGICAWCLAGIAYPVVLRLAGTGLSGVDAIHFFTSLLMCGLIGSTYPFFGAAALVIGVWYPTLVRPASPSQDDLDDLTQIERTAPFFLAMAGLVPLLGLAVLAFFNQAREQILLPTLSLGAIGFLIAIFFVWNRTAGHIATLKNLAGRK